MTIVRFLKYVLAFLLFVGFQLTDAVAASQDKSQDKASRYMALMVGIDHYDPSYGPGDLASCVNDANGFRSSVLTDTSRWSSGNIITLTDSSATKYNIRYWLDILASAAQSGDTVIYFHSSHGGTHDSSLRDTYLCSYNANYEDYEIGADFTKFRSGVSVIIVVDACYSGGLFKDENGKLIWDFAKNVMRKHQALLKIKGIAKGANVGWMTACDYYETCLAGTPYSLFTGYLIQGFSSGDANADGNVTFYELFAYASPRALAENPNQHGASLNNTLLSQTVAIEFNNNAYNAYISAYNGYLHAYSAYSYYYYYDYYGYLYNAYVYSYWGYYYAYLAYYYDSYYGNNNGYAYYAFIYNYYGYLYADSAYSYLGDYYSYYASMYDYYASVYSYLLYTGHRGSNLKLVAPDIEPKIAGE